VVLHEEGNEIEKSELNSEVEKVFLSASESKDITRLVGLDIVNSLLFLASNKHVK